MEITRKGLAMTAVVDPDGHAIGVFTDGDLRRLLETPRDWRTVPIGEVMHRNPHVVNQDHLAVEAVQIMEANRINQLLVVDGDGKLVGALHIHDLTRAKVI
ncbi:Arabinose 5-phosphate isomerase KdsD [compost metagenome]